MFSPFSNSGQGLGSNDEAAEASHHGQQREMDEMQAHTALELLNAVATQGPMDTRTETGTESSGAFSMQQKHSLQPPPSRMKGKARKKGAHVAIIHKRS